MSQNRDEPAQAGLGRRGFIAASTLLALGLTSLDLARLAPPASAAAPFWGYPLRAYGTVSTIFNPGQTITKDERAHDGIDFTNSVPGSRNGDPIFSVADGMVLASQSGGAYGNLVIIQHQDGWRSRYAHTTDGSLIEKGMPVNRGRKIATIGATGNATGPHLHFEVLNDGVLQDPWPLIRRAPLPGLGNTYSRDLTEADMSVQLWLYTPTNSLMLVDHMNMTIRNLGNVPSVERDFFSSGAFSYRPIGEPAWTNTFKNFTYVKVPNVVNQPAT